jgi:hypothetical protein
MERYYITFYGRNYTLYSKLECVSLSFTIRQVAKLGAYPESSNDLPRVGSGLVYKYKSGVEVTNIDKRSSLLKM